MTPYLFIIPIKIGVRFYFGLAIMTPPLKRKNNHFVHIFQKRFWVERGRLKNAREKLACAHTRFNAHIRAKYI